MNLLDVVDVSALAPGQYTLGIRFKSDDQIWSTVSTQTFVITAVIPPSFAVTTVGVLCPGGNNGSIDVDVSNVNPPFTYQKCYSSVQLNWRSFFFSQKVPMI